uniref:28S rRNA (Cytosine-C(5))-methyltransferase n=1 Tax=Hirondellea gigas TaxID=1518452 RepID=A0A6A7G4M0_9CRUS
MARAYIEAARLIAKVCGGAGLKSSAFGGSVRSLPIAYALTCKTLQYQSILEDILRESPLKSQLEDGNIKSKWLYLVMVYDLLFGKGSIDGSGKVKKEILKCKTALNAKLARLKIKAGVQENFQLLPIEFQQTVQFPRYVRVNTLKTSTKKVIEEFCAEGWKFDECLWSTNLHHEESEQTRSLSSKTFCLDSNVGDLLVFPHGTDLHDSKLVKNGHIILQDKSSCFPSIILDPQSDWHILDACAAPGNKTSHLAALLRQRNPDHPSLKGRIDAFDIDKKRSVLLRSRMNSLGSSDIVNVHRENFLHISPNDPKFVNAQAILIDPSCSGSGLLYHRLDHLIHFKLKSDESLIEEIRNFARFQCSLICHAMKWPNVQKIVYSTCSESQIENEEVVSKILSSHHDFELANALPNWERRGLPIFDGADHVVRVSARNDLAQGFFVACFVRKSEASLRNDTDQIIGNCVCAHEQSSNSVSSPKDRKVDDFKQRSSNSEDGGTATKNSLDRKSNRNSKRGKKRKGQQPQSNPEESHSNTAPADSFSSKSRKRKLSKNERRKKRKKMKLTKRFRSH